MGPVSPVRVFPGDNPPLLVQNGDGSSFAGLVLVAEASLADVPNRAVPERRDASCLSLLESSPEPRSGAAATVMMRPVLERHPDAFLITLANFGVTLTMASSQEHIRRDITKALRERGRARDSPIVLVGHSQGGLAVLRYAIDHPLQVRHAFTIGAPWQGCQCRHAQSYRPSPASSHARRYERRFGVPHRASRRCPRDRRPGQQHLQHPRVVHPALRRCPHRRAWRTTL